MGQQKTKRNDVEKIIKYLEGKKAKAEARLKEYSGPVMTSELRNSPHMQLEHTRLATTIETLDDVLMTIKEFCDDVPKPQKSNAKGKKV